MGAALHGVDVVGKGKDVFRIPVVVLHGDFDGRIAAHALDVDGLGKERLLVLVQVFDELDDAALVVKDAAFAAALIVQRDADAFIEKRHLAQAGFENLVLEIARLKHAVRVFVAFHIRHKGDVRAGFVGFPGHAQVVQRDAAPVFLLVHLAVLADDDLQPRGQGVDDRGADAVQAAGYLVPLAAELSARVQHGEAYLHRRPPELWVNADGEAAPVVADGGAAVLVQRDVDLRAIARQGLVDGVVHNFINQVMQAARIGGTDIHAGPFSDGLQPLQNLDLRLVVMVCRLRHTMPPSGTFGGVFSYYIVRL